ncbi:MAG TPA: hypothetical protein VG308_20995 [Stellaceae bacterium]|jgi:hypothetical protein|nr:hypothetical protein [Stellaceae bacterium]
MASCGDADALAEAKIARQCAAMAHDPNDPHDEDGNRRGAVIGLIVAALLVIAGYYLMNALRNEGKTEDCLMSGRTNCAPIDIPTHK